MRVGDVAHVVANQPLAHVIGEETKAVLSQTYEAVAAATALVPSLSPTIDDRLSSLEKIVAQLTGPRGTIQHLVEALDVANCNVNDLREQFDCRTAPRRPGETSESPTNAVTKTQGCQYLSSPRRLAPPYSK